RGCLFRAAKAHVPAREWSAALSVSPRQRRCLQLEGRIRGDQMSEIRKQGRSSKARRNRTIRIAPMTRAVRSALATSTLVLALGAAGNVSAADHALSRAQVQLLRFE